MLVNLTLGDNLENYNEETNIDNPDQKLSNINFLFQYPEKAMDILNLTFADTDVKQCEVDSDCEGNNRVCQNAKCQTVVKQATNASESSLFPFNNLLWLKTNASLYGEVGKYKQLNCLCKCTHY